MDETILERERERERERPLKASAWDIEISANQNLILPRFAIG